MIEKYLEHTNLSDNAHWKDIRDSIKIANDNKVVGFCTYLAWSGVVDKYLAEGIKKVYVIGFYTGAKELIERDLELFKSVKGDEFDVVFPLSLYSLGDITKVKDLLQKVREATKDKILKVIIETNVLRTLPAPEERIKSAIKICEEVGCNMIKSNTGRFPREVSILDDVKLIKKFTKLHIKASGGIKTYEVVKELIDLGVKRIGTSNTEVIIKEERDGRTT